MKSVTEIRPQAYVGEYHRWLDDREDDGTFSYNTVRGKRYAVDEFTAWTEYHDEVLDTEEFYDSVDTVKAFFKQTPVTKNKVAGVRGFLEYIARQLPTEQAERLNDIRDRVKRSKLEGQTGNGGRVKEIEDKILTQDELDAVVAAADPYQRVVVKTMLDTGCRPGELAALTPGDLNEDVDIDGIGATVKITKTYAQGVGVQDHPKSENSIRTVNIRPDTVELLQEFIRGHDIADYQLMFGSYRKVYDAVKELFTYAQIRIGGNGVTNFSPHWLRHNTATRLIRDGYSKEKVQRYMGHSSVTITEIYEHFNDDEVIEVYALERY